MESAEKENCWLFCKSKFDENPTVVYLKGLDNVRRIAKKNHDFELQEEVRKKSRTREDWYMLIVADCRKRFTDKRKSVDSQLTNSKMLRTKFMWKMLCFFCEKAITSHQRNFPEL